jgi:hypothetical protein
MSFDLKPIKQNLYDCSWKITTLGSPNPMVRRYNVLADMVVSAVAKKDINMLEKLEKETAQFSNFLNKS